MVSNDKDNKYTFASQSETNFEFKISKNIYYVTFWQKVHKQWWLCIKSPTSNPLDKGSNPALSFIKMSLQSWRQTNNKKWALDKMR